MYVVVLVFGEVYYLSFCLQNFIHRIIVFFLNLSVYTTAQLAATSISSNNLSQNPLLPFPIQNNFKNIRYGFNWYDIYFLYFILINYYILEVCLWHDNIFYASFNCSFNFCCYAANRKNLSSHRQ